MVGVCIFCQKVIHSFDIRKKQTLSVSREDLLVFLGVIYQPPLTNYGNLSFCEISLTLYLFTN